MRYVTGSRGRVRFYETRRTVCVSKRHRSVEILRAYVFVHPPSPEIVTTCCVKESALSVVARPAYNFIHEAFPLALSLPSVSPRAFTFARSGGSEPQQTLLLLSLRFWSPSCGKGGHAGHTHVLSLFLALSSCLLVASRSVPLPARLLRQKKAVAGKKRG